MILHILYSAKFPFLQLEISCWAAILETILEKEKNQESKILVLHWQMIMKLESREGEGYHRLFPQDLLRLPRRAGKVPLMHVALTRVRVAIANFGRSVYSGFWVGLIKGSISQ